VVGLVSSNGTCPSLDQLLQKQVSSTGYDDPYELGRAQTDVLADTSVNITMSYNSSSASRAFCLNKSALGTLAIAPATTSVVINGSATLTASGGLSPYTFSIKSGSGTIGSLTGIYSAPSSAGSAAVQVTDSLGSTAVASLAISSVAWDGSGITWDESGIVWGP
jgi:hypothetical protein